MVFNEAKKFDRDKPMVSLLDPQFILDVAKVLTFGAKKYGRDNWKKDLERNRILSALYRHLLTYHCGEKNDSETGLSHLCHIVCNAMFLYWYDKQCSTKLSQTLKIEHVLKVK